LGWGDELMVTGQVRELQAKDARRVRIIYERDERWHEAWDNNPRIARPGERGDFQEFRPRDNWRRPYIAYKTPAQWTWKPWSPPRGELYFTPEERAFGERFSDRVIIEPSIKLGASPNKDWGRKRWLELTRIAALNGIRLTQLSPIDKYCLPGVEWICTQSMRLAAAILARARLAVVHEGAMHHACAALGTPAIVIYGGYIGPDVTGYEGQRAFFVKTPGWPLGCGMWVPCKHCAEAMQSITPQMVLDAMVTQLGSPGAITAR
jgi:hypothetical protein